MMTIFLFSYANWILSDTILAKKAFSVKVDD